MRKPGEKCSGWCWTIEIAGKCNIRVKNLFFWLLAQCTLHYHTLIFLLWCWSHNLQIGLFCVIETSLCLLTGFYIHITYRQHIKKQRHYLADKGPSSQSYDFSSSHVWMWKLDYKKSWAPKNWCFWTVVLEKTLESLLDCEEIQPVHPKGNQSWIFIGRTDTEAETPIIWPPDVKNWLTGKDQLWERLKAGGEGDDRGWDGWMASPTQWAWVWTGSRS